MITLKTRKYTVQFIFEADTRWLFDRDQDVRILGLVCENIVACHTAGPRPKVEVILEELPQKEAA